MNLCLKSNTILPSFYPIFRCVDPDPDPQSSWIRIQYGNGSTTLKIIIVTSFRYLLTGSTWLTMLPNTSIDCPDNISANMEGGLSNLLEVRLFRPVFVKLFLSFPYPQTKSRIEFVLYSNWSRSSITKSYFNFESENATLDFGTLFGIHHFWLPQRTFRGECPPVKFWILTA